MTAEPAAPMAAECSPPPARPGYRPRPVRGYASGKDDYLRRLRKIEGQVRGLQKMIEADTWCPDVVTQVASATRALQEVAVGLRNDHISHCVMAATRGPAPEADARLGEVAATIRQVVRLLSGCSAAGSAATVRQEFAGGRVHELRVGLPAVIGVQAARQAPRYAPISRIRQAMQAGGLREVAADPAPATPAPAVRRMYRPETATHAEMLAGGAGEVAAAIADLLRGRGLVKGGATR